MASKLINIDDSDSDRESSLNSEDEGPETKRLRKSHDWTKVKAFNNGKEATDFVLAEKLWRRCGKYNGTDGLKIQYNCKVSSDCAAKVYVFVKCESQQADLYQTTAEHDHKPKPQWGLPETTKDKVKQLYNDGVTKPKLILTKIRSCGMEEPTKGALSSYLVRLRRKQCESHSLRIEFHTGFHSIP